jgi:SAM-dependent methyltransferase
MSTFEKYYNGFYSKLAALDRLGNSFVKISSILPILKPGDCVLDIGCGYGSVSSEFLNRGCKVSGVELNSDAIAVCRNLGIEIFQQDLSLPLNIDKNFDIILLLDILEHMFDPLELLYQAKSLLKEDGCILVTVPLYFDLLDRLKILFTGSIISMDNLCYGKELYSNFRSYNYDHIRFFRPSELFELSELIGLHCDKIEYEPTSVHAHWALRFLVKIFANKLTSNLFPNLFAHRIKIRFLLSANSNSV